jgi:hypothetical protein
MPSVKLSSALSDDMNRRCPKCSKEFRGRYCPTCGVELEDIPVKVPNRCSKKETEDCQRHICEDEDRYCKHCNAPTTYELERQKNT